MGESKPTLVKVLNLDAGFAPVPIALITLRSSVAFRFECDRSHTLQAMPFEYRLTAHSAP